MNDPPLDTDRNPLEWWGKKNKRFSQLAKLAKMLMYIPAKSVVLRELFLLQETYSV